MMRCQRRAERQAVGGQAGGIELGPAKLRHGAWSAADPAARSWTCRSWRLTATARWLSLLATAGRRLARGDDRSGTSLTDGRAQGGPPGPVGAQFGDPQPRSPASGHGTGNVRGALVSRVYGSPAAAARAGKPVPRGVPEDLLERTRERGLLQRRVRCRRHRCSRRSGTDPAPAHPGRASARPRRAPRPGRRAGPRPVRRPRTDARARGADRRRLQETMPSMPLAPRPRQHPQIRARRHVPVQVPGRQARRDPQQRAGRQGRRDVAEPAGEARSAGRRRPGPCPRPRGPLRPRACQDRTARGRGRFGGRPAQHDAVCHRRGGPGGI